MSEKKYTQALLPEFEPSENDLVQTALNLSYEIKVKKSIELIKEYEQRAVKMNSGGYNERFSGGKDSCVIDWLIEQACVRHYKTYSNTTIDPPELLDFIKTHHSNAVWLDSGRGHLIKDRAVEKRNLPTRRGKWCCEEYKNCCSSASCESSLKILGVRISESAKRAGTWREYTITKRGDHVLAPIAYWTDEDVWRCIRENNIPYCDLYNQGWTRLGCVGCPINPTSQKKEFERWPEIEKMWKDAAYEIWEISQKEKNKRGKWRFWKKFKTPEDMWKWWLTGGHEKTEQNCVFEEMMENT